MRQYGDCVVSHLVFVIVFVIAFVIVVVLVFFSCHITLMNWPRSVAEEVGG